MTDVTAQRRLSAVLAADVAGYSRLMGTDEAGTLARFAKIRTGILDPAIARFRGRLVGTAGDSLLVEFTNALAAVECAVYAQRELAASNAQEPEDQRILFRMGINLGDVIADGDTIHGDGVNVAARIEKLAVPGGLCVSRAVFELVDGKILVGFTDCGEHTVKNIAKPIHVYRAELGEASGANPGASRSRLHQHGRVSIAVLPFENMSGDPEQTYFSDGITEDIITELSKFRDLMVIARNSSFALRGKAKDIKRISEELGVPFIVEGSVRRAGNRVRVTAQLIDGSSSSHIWAERYDRDLDNIFEIQDEISRMIVAQISAQTRHSVARRDRPRPTESLSAYDCYLRAREIFRDVDDDALSKAESLAMKAVELDPGFVAPHALISDILTMRFLYSGQSAHLDRALVEGRKALDLGPDDPWANYAFGLATLFCGRLDESRHYLDRALDLNPNDPVIHAVRSNWLFLSGRYDEALVAIRNALKLDPYSYDWAWPERAIAETIAGKYHEAIETFRRAKYLPPWSLCYLAVANIQTGNMDEAKRNVAEVRVKVPHLAPSDYFARITPFVDKAKLQFIIENLRLAEST